MGKGDKKSKKGKIRMGSFGKVRPRKKAKLTFVAKKVEKKEVEVEVEVVEKTETKKKTTKKKAAVKKKTATKKAAKKKV
jgi:30S ribosomal protein S31